YNEKGKLLKDIIKNAEDTSLQTEYEYNEYGILVSKVNYKDFKEIGREDTPEDEIQKQCQQFVDFCRGDNPKKGCKTNAGHRKIVSKSVRGIQLEGVPDIIIKTTNDYAVGDIYYPKTYVEYIGVYHYTPLNITKRIKVSEFKETNMPICK
ncbi:MAG: hypothetical protein IJS34_02785, partial [Alphaproteobacteria bacterium]|nr:hypothetical protein [Alphaproteobacteria bacterium]